MVNDYSVLFLSSQFNTVSVFLEVLGRLLMFSKSILILAILAPDS